MFLISFACNEFLWLFWNSVKVDITELITNIQNLRNLIGRENFNIYRIIFSVSILLPLSKENRILLIYENELIIYQLAII